MIILILFSLFIIIVSLLKITLFILISYFTVTFPIVAFGIKDEFDRLSNRKSFIRLTIEYYKRKLESLIRKVRSKEND